MHGGDTITVHWYTTAAADGFHVTVTDLTTGGAGTIVLDSNADGPLMPSYDIQRVGDNLGLGCRRRRARTRSSGRSGTRRHSHIRPLSSVCPDRPFCQSYNAPAWADTTPIQIKSVTFGDGSSPQRWGVVSDFGGKAEVNQYCGAANYGQPFCIYPWYTLGSSGFHYGVDYADTLKDYGQADQFAQTTACSGNFGANTTYCSTLLP